MIGRVLLSTFAEIPGVNRPVEPPTVKSPALVACVAAVTAAVAAPGFTKSSVAMLASVGAELCFFSEDCNEHNVVS